MKVAPAGRGCRRIKEELARIVVVRIPSLRCAALGTFWYCRQKGTAAGISVPAAASGVAQGTWASRHVRGFNRLGAYAEAIARGRDRDADPGPASRGFPRDFGFCPIPSLTPRGRQDKGARRPICATTNIALRATPSRQVQHLKESISRTSIRVTVGG